MRFSTAILLATAYLTLGATALPNPRPAATYQVVDVGGPSSPIGVPAAETLPSTSTSSSKPATVTVTASPSKASVTTTQHTTVAVPTTAVSASSHTFATSLSPVITSEPTPSVAIETVIVSMTDTVYDTVPAPTYAAAVQPSSSSSFSSSLIPTSTLNSAFTNYGQWNQTISTSLHPSGTAMDARLSTNVPCPDDKEASSSY
ncbi:hypothetical protein DOTSEDRAFT_73729 [Dothistroma septosporum NZE10]|uniref:Uncharacterized protein n=1 Tax=Dothistroma septosporum (strain NZE10 / CBS 128990) TaxID=675120 RepID=N1PJA0_DOTSN|nr:hypothetical protein DOTSEDRAFT_73729 [Dothistroma septosporum NZE10]